jgi:chromosome segregation ATPase
MDEFLRESQKLLSSPTATVSAAAGGGITGGGGAGQIGSAHTTPTKPRISLKEQESVIDALKKENFSLKMRVHYLQETLTDITGGMSGAEDVSSSLMEENVELKLKLKEMNELLQQKTVLVNDQSANDVPQVVRDTVVEYRKEIERLEADVKNLKSELLETTSQMKQRELECDQLRAQNESLRLLSPVRSPHNQARGRPDSPSLFQGAYDSGVDAFGFSSSASKIAVSDEQLENGIGIMRQQINDLKLQLIEKSTLSDKLSLEIDSLRQMSQKQVDELNSLKQREEIRLQKTVNEMKSQIELLKRELQSKDEKLKTREKEYKENEVSFVVDKSQLESRIESMKREIDTLNRDFNEVRSEKRSLENALEMKRQQVKVFINGCFKLV